MIKLTFPPKNKKDIKRLKFYLTKYQKKFINEYGCFHILYERKIIFYRTESKDCFNILKTAQIFNIKSKCVSYVHTGLLNDYCDFLLKFNKMKTFNSFLRGYSDYKKRL